MCCPFTSNNSLRFTLWPQCNTEQQQEDDDDDDDDDNNNDQNKTTIFQFVSLVLFSFQTSFLLKALLFVVRPSALLNFRVILMLQRVEQQSNRATREKEIEIDREKEKKVKRSGRINRR